MATSFQGGKRHGRFWHGLLHYKRIGSHTLVVACHSQTRVLAQLQILQDCTWASLPSADHLDSIQLVLDPSEKPINTFPGSTRIDSIGLVCTLFKSVQRPFCGISPQKTGISGKIEKFSLLLILIPQMLLNNSRLYAFPPEIWKDF